MASQEVQADEPRPPLRDRLDVRGDHAGRAGEVAARAASRRPAAGTPTAASRRATGAAAHKRRYRVIDFKRGKDGVPAKVAAIEYDPNRSARIALLHYADGEKAYILAPAGLRVGATVESGPERRHQARQRAAAREHPDRHGRPQRRAEARPGRQARRARAGSGDPARRQGRRRTASLRLPSGEMRRVPLTCRATVGRSGTPTTRTSVERQGGPQPLAGQAPAVRGSAMNPVDHPHGGGEGKSKGGRHPVTPWGVPTLGKRTRKKHKESDS